ncbi:hypothetical protein N5E84_18700 [Vibrio sp. J502]|nr:MULTISPECIES: hypothetical protein [Vibrio]UXH30767.1 hypothetical protein N5E84_18700 [Vibrio sp. J502]
MVTVLCGSLVIALAAP